MSGSFSLRDLRRWERELIQVAQRLCPLFSRVKVQAQWTRYLQGLITQIERKNGCQLAEHLADSDGALMIDEAQFLKK